MKVALLSAAPGWIPALFLERNLPRLRAAGVDVGAIVLDEYSDTPGGRPRLMKTARRQAKVSGCSVANALARILYYDRIMNLPGGPPDTDHVAGGPMVTRVPTLNAPTAISAVRDAGCDVVCLMGARILTRKTLTALGVPIFNIHSSDPSFVRGGPVVVWEVLAGRPAIDLCVHQVTAELDSGAICARDSQPILYEGGLGATTRATMLTAKPKVTDLFERVIRDQVSGSLECRPFEPGILRTTPSIAATTRGELACRARTRRLGGARRPAVA